MVFLFYTVFAFIVITVICNNNDLSQYYIDLIQNETSRSYINPPKTNAYEYIPKSNEHKYYGMYDHIIIGAGSAGATIANRLSEDSFRNILLVEAGGSGSNFTDIPAMAPFVVGLPEYNWKSSSVPQKTCCLGSKEKRCVYHRGKGLGGSSLINFLAYTRGNKHDYNNWSAIGCSGWGYKDVLPFFKKIENFSESVSKYRGKEGFLNVETSSTINEADQAFIEANKELGREVVDYNAEEQIGVGNVQFSRINGRRHSIARAYLEPVRHRRNLNVLTNSYVIKILVNKRKKAYGILFSKNGILYTARSRSDIIVSAGSIGSPHLLMLSGIGPESHLKEMGIPVKQNLAVGSDTEDHPVTLLLHFISNRNATHTTLRENVNNYLKSTGALTNALNYNAVAFLNTGTSLNKAPDLEFLMSSFDDGNIDLGVFNIDKELYKNISKIGPNKAKFLVILFLLHPKSKGTLRLQSRNPFDYPLIDPRMLSDENNSDIETLFQGIQLVFRMTNTTAFKKMGAKYLYASHPDCQKFSFATRDYWYCNIRHFTTSTFHLVGSCKMGPNPATGAVPTIPQQSQYKQPINYNQPQSPIQPSPYYLQKFPTLQKLATEDWQIVTNNKKRPRRLDTDKAHTSQSDLNDNYCLSNNNNKQYN
ncbi:hypothetical protein FQA39_LY06043 [Lamprigera yunnana]|nr:hypothetical protein FQA39_LY06043 [Lamprigera yunnana]